MEETPFVIGKEKVEILTAKYGITPHQLLEELIAPTKKWARPPISHYHVAVAGLGKSGNIYLGVNLEFPGFPLNQSVHAEQFLIANARLHGEKGLEAMAGSAAPCGHCRQFLYEIEGADSLLIFTPLSKGKTLLDLLPEAFGPQDLGLAATLMSPPPTLILVSGETPLATAALEAAAISYAPYSEAKSGVAIQTKRGEIYRGSYLENAAFNPGLPPLQAALINLVANGEEYRDIVHVVLAESSSAQISHEEISRRIIKSLSPTAVFETILF